MFLQLVLATSQAAGVPEVKTWETVLDHWWRQVCSHEALSMLVHYYMLTLLWQFDHMSEPRYRKLVALGMASLVSTGRPEVLDRLPTEIFNLWTDVFFEVKESRKLAENEENE